MIGYYRPALVLAGTIAEMHFQQPISDPLGCTACLGTNRHFPLRFSTETFSLDRADTSTSTRTRTPAHPEPQRLEAKRRR